MAAPRPLRPTTPLCRPRPTVLAALACVAATSVGLSQAALPQNSLTHALERLESDPDGYFVEYETAVFDGGERSREGGGQWAARTAEDGSLHLALSDVDGYMAEIRDSVVRRESARDPVGYIDSLGTAEIYDTYVHGMYFLAGRGLHTIAVDTALAPAGRRIIAELAEDSLDVYARSERSEGGIVRTLEVLVDPTAERIVRASDRISGGLDGELDQVRRIDYLSYRPATPSDYELAWTRETDARDYIARMEERRRQSRAIAELTLIDSGAAAPVIRGRLLDSAAYVGPAEAGVYMFSFTNCGPCSAALAQLREGGYDFGAANFHYLEMLDGFAALERYVARKDYEGWGITFVSADQTGAEAYGVSGYPTFVEVDDAGRVSRVLHGGYPASVAALLGAAPGGSGE